MCSFRGDARWHSAVMVKFLLPRGAAQRAGAESYRRGNHAQSAGNAGLQGSRAGT
jgi:hypothetical protein